MDYEQLKIQSYKYWDLYLHENQCYLGRVFLLLREDAGVEDFLSITGDMREEFFQIGEEVKVALKTLFQPDKMNYAALSNTSPKIHVHLVPRYKETREFDGIVFHDTRWGKNYAPYDRSFSVAEKTLLQIREALAHELAKTRDDVTIRLCTTSHDIEQAKHFRQEHFFDERGIQDPYAWTLGHKDYDHYLLEKEGKVIGYASIQHWPKKRAALRIIAIAKEEQGKGYGSYMMQCCEQMLKETGTKCLHTEAHPSAVQFYRRLGYVECRSMIRRELRRMRTIRPWGNGCREWKMVMLLSVHLILLKDHTILLQKRQNTGYADALYGLPAGKINPNESATQAMIREAKEELGIYLEASWIELTSIVHGRDEERAGVAFFFQATRYEGTIENNEPDKCKHLRFFHLNSLPKRLIPYMRCGIENTLNKTFFSEFGW